MKLTIIFGLLTFAIFSMAVAAPATQPIVTAEKYMEYKRKNGHLKEFLPPKMIIVCYQRSTLEHLLKHVPNVRMSDSFSDLYLIDDGNIGILGGWGFGAPALSVKMEQLIALGTKKFIAMGTAGTLMNRHKIGDFIIAPKALAEDGVAHLYLKDQPFAVADERLFSSWNAFTKKHSLPNFHQAAAWSFSALFRETPDDVSRVTQQGYDVVEMETSTLYAIGSDKGAQTLSLFVISDAITQESWTPHIKETIVRDNLNKLAEWALEFSKETLSAVKSPQK